MYSDVRADRGVRWSEETRRRGVARRPTTTPTATPSTARAASSTASTATGASPGPSRTAPATAWWTASRASASTRPTMSSSSRTAPSGSPTRPTASSCPTKGTPAPQEQAGCSRLPLRPGDAASCRSRRDAIVHPNGLAFSPDESLLYVSDTSAALDPAANHHIVVLDVVDRAPAGAPARLQGHGRRASRTDCASTSTANVWTSAGRRHPRHRPRRHRPGADPRAGGHLQLRLRRAGRTTALHHGQLVALHHRDEGHRVRRRRPGAARRGNP